MHYLLFPSAKFTVIVLQDFSICRQWLLLSEGQGHVLRLLEPPFQHQVFFISKLINGVIQNGNAFGEEALWQTLVANGVEGAVGLLLQDDQLGFSLASLGQE